MIPRSRPPSAAGLVGAAVAAAVSAPVEPLLPLAPAVHGLVVGILAVHGYAAGVALARLAASGPGPHAGAPAAAVAAAVLLHASGAAAVGVAAAVLLLAVLLARRARAAVRAGATGRRPAVGLGLVVCLLAALPGVAAAGAPAATDALGREGRAFLDGPRTGSAIRVYAGLGSAPTVPERAAGAVAALETAGGLTRSTVLVAVPTGSGWVNRAGVGALERLVGGDAATVVLQYAQRPSWQEYAAGAGSAESSAIALVAALRTRLDARPAADRPRLLVYGESLGAIGAAAAAGAADGGLVVGTPAAAWDPAAPGSVTRVLHADDPVGWFSPRLLVTRPVGWPGEWVPVVSFWSTAASLLSALDAPPGHGHRYGDGELAAGWRTVLGAVRPAIP